MLNDNLRLRRCPLISVVVPAYNMGLFLEESLKSIIGQSYSRLEIIVVDDGSSDNTVAIARKYSELDGRIRIVSNQKRKGVAGARNTGISLANGEWCTFLDADDLWAPDSIEQRLFASEIYPDVDFFSGDYIEFNSASRLESVTHSQANDFWRQHFSPALITGRPLLFSQPINLFVQSVLTHTNCVMVKTSLLRQVGEFCESLKTAEDDHLWIRIAAHSEFFVFVPKSLSFYRLREGSLTHSGRAIHHDAVAAYTDLLTFPVLFPFRKILLVQIASFSLQNSYFYRKKGERLNAIYWGMRALVFSPYLLVHWKNVAAALLLR
ncbi:MAG: glycosyltransferase [Hydrogenophaga sp.]|uniref:glycosyltransferase n=1 Tax=Hydrogenophaga sp. TaxID=1904254 RepID=UPI00273723FB|nr:glycosyltransferase [Hydrogenophaga sp.]MDP3350563.1 glycosyltransferase [Hydrogenophaga sp.]